MGVRRSAAVAVLLLPALSCIEDELCILPPCAPPIALEVTVTSAATGAAISGVSFRQTGISAQELPCPESKCIVFGNAATYDFDISAPGYQTVRRSVVVTGENRECGCPIVNTQRLTVALPAL